MARRELVGRDAARAKVRAVGLVVHERSGEFSIAERLSEPSFYPTPRKRPIINQPHANEINDHGFDSCNIRETSKMAPNLSDGAILLCNQRQCSLARLLDFVCSHIAYCGIVDGGCRARYRQPGRLIQLATTQLGILAGKPEFVPQPFLKPGCDLLTLDEKRLGLLTPLTKSLTIVRKPSSALLHQTFLNTDIQ